MAREAHSIHTYVEVKRMLWPGGDVSMQQLAPEFASLKSASYSTVTPRYK